MQAMMYVYIYTKIVKDSIMHNIKHYPYIVTVESCYYYFNFEPLGSLAFHTNKLKKLKKIGGTQNGKPIAL